MDKIKKEKLINYYNYARNIKEPPLNLIERSKLKNRVFNIYGNEPKKIEKLNDLDDYANEVTVDLLNAVKERYILKYKLKSDKFFYNNICMAFNLESKLTSNIDMSISSFLNEVKKIMREELYFNYRDLPYEKENQYNLRDLSREFIDELEMELMNNSDPDNVPTNNKTEERMKYNFKKYFGVDFSEYFKLEGDGKNKSLFKIENPSLYFKKENIPFYLDSMGYFFSNEEKNFYKHLLESLYKYDGSDILDFLKKAKEVIKERSDLEKMEIHRLNRLTGYSLTNKFLNLNELSIELLDIFNLMYKIPSINVQNNLLDNYMTNPDYNLSDLKDHVQFTIEIFKIIEEIISIRLDVDYAFRNNISHWSGGMVNRNAYIPEKLSEFIIINISNKFKTHIKK